MSAKGRRCERDVQHDCEGELDAHLVEVDVSEASRFVDELFTQVSVTSDEVLELSTVGSVGHFEKSCFGSGLRGKGMR